MTGPTPAAPMPGPPQHPGELITATTQELLHDIDSRPVGERIEVFASVHEKLQRALTQIDAPGQ